MNPLVNFENFIVARDGISPMAFDMVAHILTLGFAVMLAAIFYFILTIRTVAPQYRISSVLSVVVMVSAFLLLFFQQQSWTQNFVFNFETGRYDVAPGGQAFSNGYRYLNWLIDVPMLLFQILFIVNITREQRGRLRNWFFFSGTMMILTGYIGQFYEAQTDLTPFLAWGFISTLFFFHVLYLIYRVIQESRKTMSKAAGDQMQMIWYLFFVSWMLYPGAYLMPLLLNNEAGIVGRQLTYTVADIASKVIYGVMLTNVAQTRSEEEGYVSDMGITKPA